MTLKELETWIQDKKELAAKSGQVIDDYVVLILSDYEGSIYSGRVDHGKNTVSFWSK